jgi:serine/threonine-protein kinase
MTGSAGAAKISSAEQAVNVIAIVNKAIEKGIVHRDIKSENIMVTPKGQVKIMDFGLARLIGRTSITEPGITLGTPAYMSPEQAEGKKVDARSDIFSLGSVLYEMVTGQKAFQGTSKMSTLSAILPSFPVVCPLQPHALV